jgi:hypothetical protein
MKNLTSAQSAFVSAAKERFGEIVSRQEIINLADEMGVARPRFIYKNEELRVGRGAYRLPTENSVAPVVAPAVVETAVEQPAMAVKPLTMTQTITENFVPAKDPLYVPFGFFTDLKKILESKMFYPVMVTGLSGNGKTFMVEQACAASKREMIKVSISIETDEDDLIGGNTLVNGNVVYREGPVLNAMRKGAVLVLDEIDRGSNKLLAIQAIAEGKDYINKKTGEVIKPAKGFQIVATANTKGKGSDDGRFIAAQILDEAFLERFPITVEQEYAPVATEKKILKKVFDSLEVEDDGFVSKLVDWADIIRKTFYEGGVDEIIATRRLVHIANAYAIFNDKMKAIELCVNRFDDETKESFLDLYTKVDGGVLGGQTSDESVENSTPSAEEEYAPF